MVNTSPSWEVCVVKFNTEAIIGVENGYYLRLKTHFRKWTRLQYSVTWLAPLPYGIVLTFLVRPNLLLALL